MVDALHGRAQRRLRLVTNSELRTFRRCSLEHHVAYELGYRALGDAESLRFGSLFHAGLEAWWLAYQTPDEQLDAAIAAMEPLALDAYDAARAAVLMQGYDARWSDAEDVEILGVELEFRAPLTNPLTGADSRTFMLGGKLDALVRNVNDGRVYIVEHKTSGEDIGTGSRYWQRLQLDSQISTYFAGARALGYEPAGCLYDVIGKPRIAPLKATPEESRKYTKQGALYANQRAEDETADEYRLRLIEQVTEFPDRFYQRGFVVRLPEEERDAAFDAWQTARLIRETQAAGVHTRNVASCERYGRMCAYFPVCTRVATLEDLTLYEHVANVHPELTPAPAEVDAAE
jgi:hypothetical protein